MQFASSAALARVLAKLRANYGERCSINQATRDQHGHGEAFAPSSAPDAVVWPLATEEVCAIARLCNTEHVPLIAFGAGTSLEGHVNAPFGGVCLDLGRMHQVLAVHAADGDCVVQPGITRKALNTWLRDTGLYFPIDPGADASIGGMISTRASGTTTIQYGSIAHNVMALEVVLADGRVIRCGTRARKSSAGYDLVRLFTGAEGTLGIITEATVRLYSRPESVGSGVSAFPELRSAVDAVIELIQLGVPLARIEFLDAEQIEACNRYSKLELPIKPTLFLEFNGSQASVTEQSTRANEVLQSHGGEPLRWASDDAGRDVLWKARHNAYFATRALRPGWECIIADVCVPVSELPECVAAARQDINAAGLVATIVGHVGDGNFHVLFLIEPGNAAQRAAMERVYAAMIDQALAVHGTCTGEHGIGLGKRAKLVQQFGTDSIALMQAVKQAWDPRGILNPGKIFLPAI
ncbi:MAG: FAD-binding oxidoreductase [Gammaproteobacteria bacterium]